MKLTLPIVNYSTLRKIKPFQNLTLVVSLPFLLVGLILYSIKIEILGYIPAVIFCIGLLPFLIFLVISIITIPFVLKRELGAIIITDDYVYCDQKGTSSKIENSLVTIKLNMEAKITTPSSIKVKDLPNWGNFIIFPNNQGSGETVIEFKPNQELTKLPANIKITSHEKTPLLMQHTGKLLNDTLGSIGPID